MALHSNQVTIKSEPTELYPIDLDGVELTTMRFEHFRAPGSADGASSQGWPPGE